MNQKAGPVVYTFVLFVNFDFAAICVDYGTERPHRVKIEVHRQERETGEGEQM